MVIISSNIASATFSFFPFGTPVPFARTSQMTDQVTCLVRFLVLPSFLIFVLYSGYFLLHPIQLTRTLFSCVQSAVKCHFLVQIFIIFYFSILEILFASLKILIPVL